MIKRGKEAGKRQNRGNGQAQGRRCTVGRAESGGRNLSPVAALDANEMGGVPAGRSFRKLDLGLYGSIVLYSGRGAGTARQHIGERVHRGDLPGRGGVAAGICKGRIAGHAVSHAEGCVPRRLRLAGLASPDHTRGLAAGCVRDHLSDPG